MEKIYNISQKSASTNDNEPESNCTCQKISCNAIQSDPPRKQSNNYEIPQQSNYYQNQTGYKNQGQNASFNFEHQISPNMMPYQSQQPQQQMFQNIPPTHMIQPPFAPYNSNQWAYHQPNGNFRYPDNPKQNRSRRYIECYFCHKIGHFESQCYAKLRMLQNQQSGKRCSYCNKPNHTADQCWHLIGQPEQTEINNPQVNKAPLNPFRPT